MGLSRPSLSAPAKSVCFHPRFGVLVMNPNVGEGGFKSSGPNAPTPIAVKSPNLCAAAHKFGDLTAIGVGAFGPLDLNPPSPTFGFITSTPKRGWKHTDLAGALKLGLDKPIYLDTDVNGAALGEQRWGAGLHLD